MPAEIVRWEKRAGLNWEEMALTYDGEADVVEIYNAIEDDNPNWEGDGPNDEWVGWARLPAATYLEAIAECQSREFQYESTLAELIRRSSKRSSWAREHYSAQGCLSVSEEMWAHSYLDSFNVIEQGYQRKKDPREIRLSVVEKVILDQVAVSPSVIHEFDPRTFEVLVSQLLTSLGFSKVTLTRFWKDQGRDIVAIYSDGDAEEVVVVEVKHRRGGSGVGLEIVDRLNGVRGREVSSKGMVVTNSTFTEPALDAYAALRDRIALIDFERLVELLGERGGWTRSPSGLWTPAHHVEQLDPGQ